MSYRSCAVSSAYGDFISFKRQTSIKCKISVAAFRICNNCALALALHSYIHIFSSCQLKINVYLHHFARLTSSSSNQHSYTYWTAGGISRQTGNLNRFNMFIHKYRLRQSHQPKRPIMWTEENTNVIYIRLIIPTHNWNCEIRRTIQTAFRWQQISAD